MGKTSCCDENGLKKGPWTTEEDQKLTDYIHKHGHGKWRTLPKNAGLKRCGKSCRLRWTNYLRPDIKRGKFSLEEEDAIIQLHKVLGNKWSAIAARLPGRTDNEIKNFWNTHIKKRLLTMGIDPVTHLPRIGFLELASLLSSSLYSTSQHLNINKNTIVESEKSELINVSPHTNYNNYSLGFGPIANQNLLNLVTSLLSSSSLHKNPILAPQGLQENHQMFPENQETMALPNTSLWQNSNYGEVYSLGYENGNEYCDSMVENQTEFMSDNGFGLVLSSTAPNYSSAGQTSLNNDSSSSSMNVNGGIEDVIRLCNY